MASVFDCNTLVYSGFKLPDRPTHYGTDLHPLDIYTGKKIRNACVYPTSKQKVTFAGWTTSGWGNLVKTVDEHNNEHYYAHLESIMVVKGEDVDINNPLGIIGTTGNSTGIHLHYEVRKPPHTPRATTAIDPSAFCCVENINGTIYPPIGKEENYNMREYVYSGEKMTQEEFYNAKKSTPNEVMAVGKEGDKLLVARVVTASTTPLALGCDLPANHYLF